MRIFGCMVFKAPGHWSLSARQCLDSYLGDSGVIRLNYCAFSEASFSNFVFFCHPPVLCGHRYVDSKLFLVFII